MLSVQHRFMNCQQKGFIQLGLLEPVFSFRQKTVRVS